MTTKTITIAGKEVTLAYCYATEIGYKLLSDEDITAYMADAMEALKESRMPDTRKTVYVVIAAINAYSEWQGEQPVISDRDLMYDATPLELGTALGTIIQLRADFYKVPSDEPNDEQPEEKKPEQEKNA
jgi:cell division protein ZapA (FtsZ GTPase activity inhibitor)